MTLQPERSTRWQPSLWKPWVRASASLLIGLALAVSWELAGHSQIQVYFNDTFVAFDGLQAHCVPKVGTGGGAQGEVDNAFSVSAEGDSALGGTSTPALIQFEAPLSGGDPNSNNYPTDCLQLCVQIGYDNETGANVPIDSLEMEVFKFAPGSNPLDPSSTPPLRTFTFSAVGQMTGENTPTNDYNNFPLGIKPLPTFGVLPGDTAQESGAQLGHAAFCTAWDGSYNIQGLFGRSNGDFGFRVTAKTNRQNPQQGNITIVTDPPGVYPGIEGGAKAGSLQVPITIDVVDIHAVVSTPTVIGSRPAITVAPYNLRYRLSKDALVYIDIEESTSPANCNPGSNCQSIRHIVPWLPRIGEGIPNGTLANNDAWNGRDANGNLFPPGNYYAVIQGTADNPLGADSADQVVEQLSMDPLQITDITPSPLAGGSTSLALMTFTLSENATAFLDIYPPGTNFIYNNGTSNSTNGLQFNFNTNAPGSVPGAPCNYIDVNGNKPPVAGVDYLPSACLFPTVDGTNQVAPLWILHQEETSRTPVTMVWAGQNSAGQFLDDGNYVYAVYAAAPSAAGVQSGAGWKDPSVFTSQTKAGILPIVRGLVATSQITPVTSVMGSSPPVAGLDPVNFSYSIGRNANVTVQVFHETDTVSGAHPATPEKTLALSSPRSPGLLNVERWIDGYSDYGYLVNPGDYLVELQVTDPISYIDEQENPATVDVKVTTTAATFPISLLRMTNVTDTALLAGATDRIYVNYQISRPMYVTWTIYPAGSSITGWSPNYPGNAPVGVSGPGIPPCQSLPQPPLTINGQMCQSILGSNGSPAVPVYSQTYFRPGRPLSVTESWDGRDPNGIQLADGVYPFTLVATTTEPVENVSPGLQGLPYIADREIGTITVARGPTVFQAFGVVPTIAQVFNSSQVVTLPPFEIDFAFTRTSSATITVYNNNIPPGEVRYVEPGNVFTPGILNKEFWDGRDDDGAFVTKGFYTVVVIGEDVQTQLIQPTTFQQTIAVDPIVIYDVATSPVTLASPNAQVAYQVSEAMKVGIKIYQPNTTFDINGNPTPPDSQSLVRALVGVKPARVQIKDLWDGKDLQLTTVPDGDYEFRIFGSTTLTDIDSITGDIAPGATLADGGLVSEVPVTRNGTANPANDFYSNTILYPNPVPPGMSATAKIRVPLAADVQFKVYTLAGDLVLQQDLGTQEPDSYVMYTWNRTNGAGRPVAPGIYFWVFRETGILGDKSLFQTVKKIMVQ